MDMLSHKDRVRRRGAQGQEKAGAPCWPWAPDMRGKARLRRGRGPQVGRMLIFSIGVTGRKTIACTETVKALYMRHGRVMLFSLVRVARVHGSRNLAFPSPPTKKNMASA